MVIYVILCEYLKNLVGYINLCVDKFVSSRYEDSFACLRIFMRSCGRRGGEPYLSDQKVAGCSIIAPLVAFRKLFLQDLSQWSRVGIDFVILDYRGVSASEGLSRRGNMFIPYVQYFTCPPSLQTSHSPCLIMDITR